MAEKVGGHLQNGIDFLKTHPQIFYTAFIGLVIVGGFIFTSQLFLKTANEVQTSFEINRLGSLQDGFIEFAAVKMDAPDELTQAINRIVAVNTTTLEFRVVRNNGEEYPIIASLDSKEIGTSDAKNKQFYTNTFQNPELSAVSEITIGGKRVFKSTRAIQDSSGTVIGWVTTTTSLAAFDANAQASILRARLILVGVILLIMILFIRHARIIDYATLYARLKEVDQMKDDFVSMASHELRSPLTVIRGYTDLAKNSDAVKQVPDEPRKKLSETLERIDTSARQLDGLVADILDVSRLNQGRLQVTMKDVNIAELAKTVTDSFKMPAEQKGLAISFEGPQSSIISADPDRLRQVMVNLIGNAVKYTPKGTISVEVKEVGGNTVLRVSDTGMGITAEEQKNLFQKFYRIKSEETREITGTGLGLWITAEIVKRMNGTVSVESIKGVGSHFIVVFPKKM